MILLLLHTASAITIRHDVPDSDHTDLAADFAAVGHLGGCTATLIAPDRVLTAAPCFDDDGDGEMEPGMEPEGFFSGPSWDEPDSSQEIAGYWLHPGRTRQTREQWDVAVIQLTAPVVGVAPMVLGTADPVGEDVVLVGYGGTGEDADFRREAACDGWKRAAWNTVDGRDDALAGELDGAAGEDEGDTGADPDGDADEAKGGAGAGCSTAPAAAGLWALVAPALLAARRRRAVKARTSAS